ncbi:MAG: TrmB family transcriptional regulator [Candidatus Thorarchaeota archaeon]|nr:MAG: TrmB family transcriptional regulator [Candidatus Thorarchaeota archaeon]
MLKSQQWKEQAGMDLKISEATLKAMKDLGLTEYEVQAYVALVDGGQLPASEISAMSKVPYSRIYDVLGRLEEKGFVQIQRGRPTRYVAKAPTEVVRLVRLDVEERIEKSGKVVIDELQPRFEQELHEQPRDVWLLHGRAAIVAKAIGMLDNAREEVLLSIPSLDITSEEGTGYVEDLSGLIDRLLNLRNPKIRILTSDVPKTVKALVPENTEVRVRERVFGAGLVIDRRETLIMIAGGDEDSTFLGVYSSHAVFAEMSSSYFESLWTESKPL